METGKIKAVWIMGTNPAVSLPHSASVRRALEKCELVVVSDVTGETDTLRHAHIKLPALAWGEKEGSVTNSERRISRQRAFLPVPGEARADWWILAEVGKRLGHTQAFSYGCPAEIFGEHAALSAFENDHTRAFTIGALANLEKHQYDSLAPVQWPITEDRPQDTTRLFNDGKFFTPTGKAQFVAISSAGKKKEDTPDFPLLINTGRIRDQWHTMTRTGLSSRLAKHTPEPSITLHPYDAENLRVKEGGLALISTPQGNLITRVRVDGGQRPGEAFLPMHWNGCFASRAGANTLIAAHSDPISGQPEFKRTAGVIAPFHPKWSGVLLSRASVPSPAVAYWARYRGAEVWSYQLADEEPLSLDALRALLPLGSETDLSEYVDENGSRYRAALWSKGRLVSYLWAASDGIPPVTHWIEEIFHRHEVATEERMALLAGRPLTDSAPAGRAVCACHGVDENAVCAAIAKGCDSIASIGEKTKAGTGCGACMPELSRLLSQAATAKRR